jgi:hypothetical protein
MGSQPYGYGRYEFGRIRLSASGAAVCVQGPVAWFAGSERMAAFVWSAGHSVERVGTQLR